MIWAPYKSELEPRFNLSRFCSHVLCRSLSFRRAHFVLCSAECRVWGCYLPGEDLNGAVNLGRFPRREAHVGPGTSLCWWPYFLTP